MESSKGMKNVFAGYKKLKDVCWVHNDTTHRYRIQMWDGEQISKDQFAFLSLSNAFNMYVVRIVVHTSRNMWFLMLECVCFYFVSCTKANFVITFLLRPVFQHMGSSVFKLGEGRYQKRKTPASTPDCQRATLSQNKTRFPQPWRHTVYCDTVYWSTCEAMPCLLMLSFLLNAG